MTLIGVDVDTIQRELESSNVKSPTASSTAADTLQNQIQAKKAKNQKKKDKKLEKEQTRITEIKELKSTAGPSQRDQELSAINTRLLPLNLKVKEILSDGNCLYRAVADQCRVIDKQNLNTNLVITEDFDLTDFATMRILAGAYIRQHSDSFAPFLGIDIADPEFESYCTKIENVVTAEWGGQLEIRALSECLRRPIHVYEASVPVLKMGEIASIDGHCGESVEPIIITYHRHYYALGEHYNSVTSIT